VTTVADELYDDIPPEPQSSTKSNAAPKGGVTDAGPFRRANDLKTADICDRLGIDNDGTKATCPGCKEPGAAIALNSHGLKCLHNRCSSKGKKGFRTNVDLVAEVRVCSAVDAVNWLAEQFGFEGVKPKTESSQSTTAIQWIKAAELALPLPPVPWRVKGIQLCPGRPGMIAAYGSTQKTISAQDMLIAYASGGKVWGEFSTGGGGTARHFDYDQGRYASTRRYQRLSLGRGINLAELGDRLALAPFPDVYLNSANAVDIYARECEGIDLVLLDALRGATPGADENDSKIRYCIDNLTRTSEKIGTAFVIIHHAGKPKEGHADARTLARGSSAIFDACGCVLVMTGEKGAPKLVTQVKPPAEAEGGAIDDFYLEIEDVPDGASPTAGLRMVYRSVEQVCPPRKPDDKFEKLKDSILSLVRDNHELTSLNGICARVTGGGKDTKIEAIRELLRNGKLAQPGGEGSAYRVVA
jgi:hypothetical protein